MVKGLADSQREERGVLVEGVEEGLKTETGKDRSSQTSPDHAVVLERGEVKLPEHCVDWWSKQCCCSTALRN